jgi:N-acetylneuraminic acid mutarotase
LVFGGAKTFRRPSRQGFAYDPKADRWTSLPRSPLSARAAATAVWTGREVLLWGGVTGPNNTGLLDGAIFRPASP